MNEKEDRRRYTRCSFCGKGQDQVRKLVAGPGVFICDQCIDLCQEVLNDDHPARRQAERLPSTDVPRPDASPLTARELQLAILFAHGMGVKAIASCVLIKPQAVEVHLMTAYMKMSASPKPPLNSPSRRDMHDWLSARGLLPDKRDSEAVLARAISAWRSVPKPTNSPASALPAWIQVLVRSVIGRRSDRIRLEKRRAEEKAALEEARLAMREPFDRED